MTPKLELVSGTVNEFKNTLRQYSKLNSRTWEEIVTAKGMDLGLKSMQHTEKMNRIKVAHQLGKVGDVLKYGKRGKLLRSGKTGRTRTGGILIKEDSYASRLVNAELKAKGQPKVFGQELISRAVAKVNSIVNAGGFIASGWIYPIKRLAAVVKDPKVKSGLRILQGDAQQRGRPKGYAIIANPSHFYPTVTIANTANKGDVGAYNVGAKGLQKGYNATVADMRVYIERKMVESAKKMGLIK